MIELEKKDYEAVVSEIVSTKDLRLLIEKSIKNHRHYRSIVLDISKGPKSRNFKIIKEISKSKKISESFIVDQAKSVVSFFSPDDVDELEDYYKILECSQHCGEEEIRNNWIRLMKLYHPDKIGQSGIEKTKKINEAYNILIDPQSRERYDRAYFPDIPLTIKNLNYIQFNNKRFVAIIAAVLLSVPSFYIYQNISNKDDSAKIISNKSKVNETAKEQHSKTIKKNGLTSEIAPAPVENPEAKELAADNKLLVINENLELKTEEQPGIKEGVFVEAGDIGPVEVEQDSKPKQQGNNLQDTNQYQSRKVKETEVAEVKKTDQIKALEAVELKDDTLDTDVLVKKVDVQLENSIQDTEPPKEYVVQRGDSLWSLSNRFNVPVEDIKNQNSINRNKIKSGQVLILAKSEENSGTQDVKLADSEEAIDNKKRLPVSNNNKKQASKLSGTAKTTSARSGRVIDKELVELASLNAKRKNIPDKSSVYTAISEYIFAYKNRDIKKLGALFDVHAKENGMSIDEVFKKYRKNFEALNIVAYDIKFNKVDLNKMNATVDGNFIISFTNIKDDVFKKSYGDIKWKLTWNNNSWLINEIRYNVTSTKVGDESNR